MSGRTLAVNETDGLDPNVWRVAAVVCVGPFMTQIDSTVVNVSLSSIGAALHAPIAATQWVITAYLLALALMLPLNGWLVNRFGAKRLYVACFTAFTLASLLCGAASTMNMLIAARLLQGISGGLLVPMTQMMIARVAGKHMARVLGYTVAPILIAPILGPILAGVILKYASWPWLFYLNLPIGLLGVVLAIFLLPADEAAGSPQRFDLVGFLLLSPGLACLLFGLQQASQHGGGAILLLGVVLIAAFVVYGMRRGSAALVDLRLFGNRTFLSAAVTQFFSNSVFYARQFLIPLYLIVGCAQSASQAGWMMAAMGGGMMCSFPRVGGLTERYGCRAVSAGGALVASLGILPFLWMIHTAFSPYVAVASLFVAGVGHGTVSIPSVSAAYAAVAKDQLAVANTALNIVQRLGGPLATTLIAIVMSSAPLAPSSESAHRFMLAFLLLSGLHLLVFGVANFLPAQIHRSSNSTEPKSP